MPAATTLALSAATSERPVKLWLYGMAVLVFAMVLVGGATRLTDSGLSITEWQPILGAIPPLDESHWLEAFEKYRQIPEYHLVNRGMSLDDFKVLYWWEWAHRFLGRAIGLAFAIPLAVFWLTGRLSRALLPKLLGLLLLGAAQGALGWYMVMSGLADRVDVSQYRLAAHLTFAAVIFAAILWVALGIGNEPRRLVGSPFGLSGIALLLLVFLQIAAGGLVAGLDAGMGYNTWPAMDGSLIPSGLAAMTPWWRNLFENALTVQFDHRTIAYALALAAALNTWRLSRFGVPAPLRISGALIAGTVLVQIGIGVWTLLMQVPLPLGLLHQAGAFLVLAAAVLHLHRVGLSDVVLSLRSSLPLDGGGQGGCEADGTHPSPTPARQGEGRV